jgi:hypothetical protein
MASMASMALLWHLGLALTSMDQKQVLLMQLNLISEGRASLQCSHYTYLATVETFCSFRISDFDFFAQNAVSASCECHFESYPKGNGAELCSPILTEVLPFGSYKGQLRA